MKKLVFCSACKFFKREDGYGGYTIEYCTKKLLQYEISPIKMTQIRIAREIYKYNKDNSCPYYEPSLVTRCKEFFNELKK